MEIRGDTKAANNILSGLLRAEASAPKGREERAGELMLSGSVSELTSASLAANKIGDSGSPLASALQAPGALSPHAPVAAVDLEAIDREKAALIAEVIGEGTLEGAAGAAKLIAGWHGKPRHAEEVCAMADRLIENEERREQVKAAAALIVLGEWKSPARIMLAKELDDEDKRAFIFPINGRAAEVLREIKGGEPLAQAIDGTSALGVTPWLHACRDISAMDAPRERRKHKVTCPDGRLSLQEIYSEMKKNDERPGRDPKVTAQILARYEATRND